MHATRNPVLVCFGLLTAVVPTTCLFVSVNIYFFVPLVVGLGCAVVGCLKMPKRGQRAVTLLGVALCLTAAVGPFSLAAYFNRSGLPIRVVLPVGYRGEFSIVKDRTKGQDLKLQDGVWVFEIPAGGVLVVNDDFSLYMWHQESYVYANGRPARVESLGTTAGSIDTGPGSSRSSTDHEGGRMDDWSDIVMPAMHTRCLTLTRVGERGHSDQIMR
jgi:hypothetical protein